MQISMVDANRRPKPLHLCRLQNGIRAKADRKAKPEEKIVREKYDWKNNKNLLAPRQKMLLAKPTLHPQKKPFPS
jgi:hypothetical protein